MSKHNTNLNVLEVGQVFADHCFESEEIMYPLLNELLPTARKFSNGASADKIF